MLGRLGKVFGAVSALEGRRERALSVGDKVRVVSGAGIGLEGQVRAISAAAGGPELYRVRIDDPGADYIALWAGRSRLELLP